MATISMKDSEKMTLEATSTDLRDHALQYRDIEDTQTFYPNFHQDTDCVFSLSVFTGSKSLMNRDVVRQHISSHVTLCVHGGSGRGFVEERSFAFVAIYSPSIKRKKMDNHRDSSDTRQYVGVTGSGDDGVSRRIGGSMLHFSGDIIDNEVISRALRRFEKQRTMHYDDEFKILNASSCTEIRRTSMRGTREHRHPVRAKSVRFNSTSDCLSFMCHAACLQDIARHPAVWTYRDEHETATFTALSEQFEMSQTLEELDLRRLTLALTETQEVYGQSSYRLTITSAVQELPKQLAGLTLEAQTRGLQIEWGVIAMCALYDERSHSGLHGLDRDTSGLSGRLCLYNKEHDDTREGGVDVQSEGVAMRHTRSSVGDGRVSEVSRVAVVEGLRRVDRFVMGDWDGAVDLRYTREFVWWEVVSESDLLDIVKDTNTTEGGGGHFLWDRGGECEEGSTGGYSKSCVAINKITRTRAADGGRDEMAVIKGRRVTLVCWKAQFACNVDESLLTFLSNTEESYRLDSGATGVCDIYW
ncbi:hypothetical protein Tco_1467538 [Tanacetum coccineum]